MVVRNIGKFNLKEFFLETVLLSRFFIWSLASTVLLRAVKSQTLKGCSPAPDKKKRGSGSAKQPLETQIKTKRRLFS